MLLAFATASLLTVGDGTTNVLFLGNSYTATNNLPAAFEQLALAGGHAVHVEAHTVGGITLGYPQGGQEHASNPTSLGKIATGGWDVVVLQDQSFLPLVEAAQETFMETGAASLASAVAASSPGAQVLLFATWGREAGGQLCGFGGCTPDFPDMAAMTAQLEAAYWDTALEVGADLAPVGAAWVRALELDPGLDLYKPDGSHPSAQGTYLAACTFYAAILDATPVGLTFTGGLPAATAALLQDAAADVTPAVAPSCTPAVPYGPGLGGTGVQGSNTLGLSTTDELELWGTGTLVLDGLSPAQAATFVAVAAAPAALAFAGGTLLVDLGLTIEPVLLGFQFPPDGTTEHVVAVPGSPQLVGLQLFAQGAALDASGVLSLSNGLTVTICP